MVRNYRANCLINSSLSAEGAEKEVQKVLDYVTKHDGKIIKTKNFGLLKTEYSIQKSARSHYFVVDFSINPEFMKDLSTNIVKVNSNIVRYMHTRLDDLSRDLDEMSNISEPQKVRMRRNDLVTGNSAYLNDLGNLTGITGKINSRTANRLSLKVARKAAKAIKRRRFIGLLAYKARFKSERVDRSERSERPERSDRPERQDRSERSDRS